MKPEVGDDFTMIWAPKVMETGTCVILKPCNMKKNCL